MMVFKFRAMFHNGQWTYSNPKRMSVFWKDEEDDLFISETVTQSTGLLDKNKKEIYTGDILCLKTKSWNNKKDCSCWKKEIVWIKCLNLTCTKAFFDLEAKKMWDNGYSYEDYSDDWELTENKEIIGNIYQHPELLEEAK